MEWIAQALNMSSAGNMRQQIRRRRAGHERKGGLTQIADLHIRVDGEISVRQGHAIAHLVVHSLLDSDLNLSDVTVHIEPEPIPPA